MSLYRDVNEILRYIPFMERLRPEKEQLTILFRTPLVSDKPRISAATRKNAMGFARPVSEMEMDAALKVGIRELFAGAAKHPGLADLSPADLAEIENERLNTVTRWFNDRLTFVETLEGDVREEWETLRDRAQAIESEIWTRDSRYKLLKEAREDYEFQLRVESVRRFCVGVENLVVDGKPAKIGKIGPDGLTDKQLDLIPLAYVEEAGLAAGSTTGPTRQEAKNSPSPSRTRSTPRITSAAKSSRPKTPAPKKAPGVSKRSTSETLESIPSM